SRDWEANYSAIGEVWSTTCDLHSASVSAVLGRHTSKRSSAWVTIKSSKSAKPVSTRIPANTVLMSNTPSACRIRYPTPFADPRYSPTTAPTNAMPIDVCRLENTHEVADGR